MGLTVGDVLPFGVTVKDASGALANPTQMTLTITQPDNTSAPGSPLIVSPTSTGTFGYDLASTMVGRYVGYWQATGVNSGAFTQVFDVASSSDPAVVSLAQAKAHLNLATTASDDELELFLATATKVVEYFVGPVVVRPYTQRVSARLPTLTHLPRTGPGLDPVLTLTSLTPLYTTGITWDLANVVVDPETGSLRQANGFPLYGGPWMAVYTAGQKIVDPDWQLAALIEIDHLWRTQRGAAALPLAAPDDTFIPGLGFAIPNRAADLLKLDSLLGFA